MPATPLRRAGWRLLEQPFLVAGLLILTTVGLTTLGVRFGLDFDFGLFVAARRLLAEPWAIGWAVVELIGLAMVWVALFLTPINALLLERIGAVTVAVQCYGLMLALAVSPLPVAADLSGEGAEFFVLGSALVVRVVAINYALRELRRAGP